ncbi:MAG: nif-specific transcriptional activator NifA [Polyangiales bacterium]
MSDTEVVESYGFRAPRNAEVALLGIYEISKVLTVAMPLEAVLGRVANLLSSFLDMSHGLIALLGEDGSADVVVGSHCDPASARRYFERLPVPVIGRIVVTQMPLVIENVKQDPLFSDCEVVDEDPDVARVSFVGVPIKDRGKVIGTLSIDRAWKPDDRIGFRFDDDVRFLTMVANLLGQTVRLQQLVLRDRERLLQDRSRLEKALGAGAPAQPTESSIHGIVGESAALRAVMQKVKVVARSQTTVLLRGESGTGKELFARALHDLSARREQPFITLNCAALPESVLESELFGHEKGAFTGANNQRKGRFELADKGTLFLDEIGEISPAFQAKLLRVLQIGEFERVGGSQTLKVDVRLVSATNRNLEQAVTNGDFRADLYYRISVVPIMLPPLRDRQSDIPLLAREFLQRFNSENGTELELTEPALGVLNSCWFPGNVRELENCVRRTATLAHGTSIVASDFACRNDECLSAMLWNKGPNERPSDFVPLPITRGPSRNNHQLVTLGSGGGGHPAAVNGSANAPASAVNEELAADDVLSGDDPRSERERLVDVMESVGWVQAKAARVLGLTPRQVGYALRKHEIPIKKF